MNLWTRGDFMSHRRAARLGQSDLGRSGPSLHRRGEFFHGPALGQGRLGRGGGAAQGGGGGGAAGGLVGGGGSESAGKGARGRPRGGTGAGSSMVGMPRRRQRATAWRTVARGISNCSRTIDARRMSGAAASTSAGVRRALAPGETTM